MTEAGDLDPMEKHSFMKVLKEVKQKGIPIKQLTTDDKFRNLEVYEKGRD